MTTICTGPLFDSRADAYTDDFCEEVTSDIAQHALSGVQFNLDASIKYPTPYYETQIRIKGIPGGKQVDDRGVIYGHWLEGTGSRNAPKTRFRGYFSFRRAYDSVSRNLDRYTERARRNYMRRLGG